MIGTGVGSNFGQDSTSRAAMASDARLRLFTNSPMAAPGSGGGAAGASAEVSQTSSINRQLADQLDGNYMDNGTLDSLARGELGMARLAAPTPSRNLSSTAAQGPAAAHLQPGQVGVSGGAYALRGRRTQYDAETDRFVAFNGGGPNGL
jgi:hypothetical protein